MEEKVYSFIHFNKSLLSVDYIQAVCWSYSNVHERCDPSSHRAHHQSYIGKSFRGNMNGENWEFSFNYVEVTIECSNKKV